MFFLLDQTLLKWVGIKSCFKLFLATETLFSQIFIFALFQSTHKTKYFQNYPFYSFSLFVVFFFTSVHLAVG